MKEYRALQDYQKQTIIEEGMVLLPEIFSNNYSTYLNLSIYLLQEYQIVSVSLRNVYSAGGKLK